MENWTPKLIASVWAHIDHREHYDWSIEEPTVGALRCLVPEISQDISNMEDRAEANRLLRRELNLMAFAPQLRSQVALWIVGSWGGIVVPDDEATIAKWLVDLGEFTPAAVDDFIERMGTNRVSSWSKVLAFANRELYAIYDSWTAIALNYGLAREGENRRFFMPPGRVYVARNAQSEMNRGQVRELARKALRPGKRPDYVRYSSYLGLLREAVRLGLAEDLLAAEMFLFANGPVAAKSAVEAYSA